MSNTGRNMAGKVCLVTGASRGIGKGIAAMLSKAGATVYVTGSLTLLLVYIIILAWLLVMTNQVNFRVHDLNKKPRD